MPTYIGMISLGCPKNLVDTEILLGILKRGGNIITNNPEEAEVIIINTCSFIHSAKKESIETILEMGQMKGKGRCKALIVTGCLVQQHSEDLFKMIPEIDFMTGTGEFLKIADIINNYKKGDIQGKTAFINEPVFLYDHHYPRLRTTWPHFAYIKIAEGCNHGCSYCLIPKLRGRYRSRDRVSILKEARSLILEGVKEICLVAQDTTAYGCDIGREVSLSDLLEGLAKIEDAIWIRFLYTHPSCIGRDLLESMAKHPNIAPYLDIPLQHVDSKILKAMNRPMDIEKIKDIICLARQIVPDIVIRTTFIVGFPGETEREFESLLEFVEDIRFDRLGVFVYSPERGTKAYKLPNQVKQKIKENRYHKIMKLQAEISKEKNQSLKGRIKEAIGDYPDPVRKGVMVGRIKEQALEIDGVTFIHGDNLKSGEIYNIKITETDYYDLDGIKV